MPRKQSFTEFINILEEKHGPITLERRIIANGANQVTAFTSNGHFIQHIKIKMIPPSIFETLPIQKDYRLNNPPCARCGAYGTELHHWAPQHLFEDSELWPQSYLCKLCHDKWHLIIQNHKPYLVSITDDKP